jgi:hypothetical protein
VVVPGDVTVRDGASVGIDMSISIEVLISERRVKQVVMIGGSGWDVMVVDERE